MPDGHGETTTVRLRGGVPMLDQKGRPSLEQKPDRDDESFVKVVLPVLSVRMRTPPAGAGKDGKPGRGRATAQAWGRGS
jgi:hypothetical protein